MFKKLLVAAAFAATALAAAPAFADVTVGNHDGGNCFPFQCNGGGTSVGQSIDYYQIYSAAAFAGPLSFKRVGFEAWPFAGEGPGVLNGNYDISFATTTAGLYTDFPVAPLANVAAFFNGALGGVYPSGVFWITGAAYNYNPADGDLVMRVVASNQDLVLNGSGNGYMWADATGTDTTRSYLLGAHAHSSIIGALSTTFSVGVPEPASWALMIVGFAGLGGALRQRRRLAIA